MAKICAFGDSVLKGVIFENNVYKISKDRFSNICERTLNIAIENKAKFGSTITTGEEVLKKNINILESPEIEYVILEFGGNDCDFKWEEISKKPNEENLPKSIIEDFKITYTNIISAIKKYGKKVVLLSLPPINAKKYIDKITRNANRENILYWMQGNIQFLNDWHERYNIEVFKLAIYNNVPIIDITSKFLEQKDYSSFLCEDGIHPNVKGHKLIAESIFEHIAKKNIKL